MVVAVAAESHQVGSCRLQTTGRDAIQRALLWPSKNLHPTTLWCHGVATGRALQQAQVLLVQPETSRAWTLRILVRGRRELTELSAPGRPAGGPFFGLSVSTTLTGKGA
jgi:hypothetical protein